MCRYFKRVVNSDYILKWKSKGLSDESIKSPSALHNFLNSSLNYFGTKIRARFNGSCLEQDKRKYGHKRIVNVYIVYEINKNDNTGSDPTIESCLFSAISLTKTADIDKYKHFGCRIGFNRNGFFSHPGGGTGRNIIIFGVDMSSSTKIDNRKKDILILGKGPTQGLEHTLSAEKMYSINFTENNKKFCLSLHYNGANSYLFVNGIEIYKFKAKDSEIVTSLLFLRNILNDYRLDNIKKDCIIVLLLQLKIFLTVISV